ncbi:MAG: hypothetical protein GF383_12690 [Candidatus Lokiarchaeota archaeon]|nr:hypothetical protein [Candidatus Lokiarchaeota archaeon]MBD3341916.1 hypothetical protein [Candidatus Lokiarchaeota archaeon]
MAQKLKSYMEIIKDDDFDVKSEYSVSTDIDKMCWGCETKHKSGHMVWDSTQMRRFFFCDECFENLKK